MYTLVFSTETNVNITGYTVLHLGRVDMYSKCGSHYSDCLFGLDVYVMQEHPTLK
jgi:hypothetical protein